MLEAVKDFFNFGKATEGFLKAPGQSLRAVSGGAGASSGPIGKALYYTTVAPFKMAAAGGMRVAQGGAFVIAPFAALGGGLFAAKKLSDHLEHREEANNAVAEINQNMMQTQALINANPMDPYTAAAVNQQMMVAAQSAQLQGRLADAPSMALGADNQ